MASPRDAFVEHCLELLAPLGAVRARRMFGGHGLYVDEFFVAIVAFDRLYLKVDDLTRAAIVAAGGQPFAYEARGRPVTIGGYFSAPDDAMESPDAMQPWARQALAAAVRARAARPASASRKPAAKRPARAASPRKPAAAARAAVPSRRKA
jgi:DNA transformation protein and related proteins